MANPDLETILKQIKNENDLLHQRVSWMCTIQGLLFAGLGLLLREHFYTVIAVLLSFVGFYSSVSIGYILKVGADQLDKLNGQAGELVARAKLDWLLPWRSLPWVIAAFWLILMVYIPMLGK